MLSVVDKNDVLFCNIFEYLVSRMRKFRRSLVWVHANLPRDRTVPNPAPFSVESEYVDEITQIEIFISCSFEATVHDRIFRLLECSIRRQER